jgi:hypothetical protein
VRLKPLPFTLPLRAGDCRTSCPCYPCNSHGAQGPERLWWARLGDLSKPALGGEGVENNPRLSHPGPAAGLSLTFLSGELCRIQATTGAWEDKK